MDEKPDLVTEVVIAGGGHTGLLLALALDARGIESIVVDADAPDAVRTRPFDGRALALMRRSKRAMADMGAWGAVAPAAEAVEHAVVIDAVSGAEVHYDAEREGGGPFAWGIENRELRRRLLDAVDGQGIRLVAPARLESVTRERGCIVVRTDTGRRIGGALLAGADGRGSTVRRLAGIGASRRDYGQTALTFAIRCRRRGRATVRELMRPPGPLALLPLPHGLTSVTWVETSAEAGRLLERGTDGIAERLAALVADKIGAFEIVGRPTAHPLGAIHARRYVAPRIALVGDAAHGIHPIHAQGFNLGVTDIVALSEILGTARRAGSDLGAAEHLIRYERRRMPENTRTLALTEGLNALFSNELPPLALLRRIGLEAVENLPPLKRLAIREGSGLAR